MDPLLQAAKDYAGATTDTELKSIATLARKQLKLELQVSRLEAQLKGVKEDLRYTAEVELPEAMSAVGLSHFALDTGEQITVKQDIYANISADNKDGAFKWLKEHGHVDLIKNNIVLGFTKGQTAEAEQCIELLRESGYKPTTKEEVHWQTLRAFAREQIEDGNTEFPMDLFGVHFVNKTTIQTQE